MSQTKAQLIQPIGVVTASGVVVSGVMTAGTFDGDIVGSATSIIQGTNLNLGAFNATSFAGDFTGNATGIITSSAIKVGQLTASSFVGDFTGTATSMAKGTGFKAGTVTATPADVTYTVTVSGGDFYLNSIQQPTPSLYPGGTYTFDQSDATNGTHPLRLATAADAAGSTEYTFQVTTNGTPGSAGAYTRIVVSPSAPDTLYYYCSSHSGMGGSINITNMLQGAVTGAVTGDVKGNIAGNVTGNVTGSASGVADGLGVSYNGGWTGAGTSQISVGVITATTFYGDGSNLDGVSGGPVSAQSVTANSGTTAIDLSNGNLIYMTQSADTTVSFANSENGDVYIIRTKDDNSTERTITWPTGIGWSGGSAPTLLDNPRDPDAQVFLFTTRNEGVKWYGKEIVRYDPQTFGLWSWAYDGFGNLGQNETTQRSSPVQVGTEATWSVGPKTDCGNSAAIKTDGTLWVWGRQEWGGSGQNIGGEANNYSSPTQIPGTTWSQISGGAENINTSWFGTKSDGTIWSWGDNEYGNLGLNNRTQYSSPTQVGTDTTWSQTAGAASEFLSIKTDGTLWGMGRGWNGTLGNNLGGANAARSSPTQIGTQTTWSSISGNGQSATIATKTDGTLWGWGSNQSGRLGLNNKTQQSSPAQIGTDTTWSTSVKSIGGGFYENVCIKTDGTLWAWGNNTDGKLGQNNGTFYSSPVQIPGTTWSSVNCSQYCIQATKTDGTLWAWGANLYGGLGINIDGAVPTRRSSPVQIPGTWATGENQLFGSSRTVFAMKAQ